MKKDLHERQNDREKVISQEGETEHWIAGFRQENCVIKSAFVSSMHILQLTICNSEKQTHKLLVGTKQ